LPTSRLDFYQDYARFKANQGFGYLELYFAIPRDCFRYEMAGAEYRARMEINVRVFLNDTLVSSQSWKNRDEVDSLGVIKKGQIFYDLYSIYLKEGTYQIRTKVTDLIGLQEKEKILNVTMKLPERNKLELSDIQLATRIFRDKAESKFVKNGYKILPNPGGIYGTSMPVLYYYMEIYHLYPLTNALDSTYVVNIKYKDSEGKVVKQLPPKSRIRKASSLVELGNIFVGSLMTGYYRLQIEVIDCALHDTVTAEKPFYIYRPQDMVQKHQRDQTEGFSWDNEYLSMNEKSLDTYFGYAVYIATRDEIKTYKKLNLEGKRNFLRNFWKKRDYNLMTPQNEFKDQYLNRVHLANQRYSSISREGWKTDRGRVLILYGEPDDIQRNSFSGQSKAYEIWWYHKVEGGVEFIFADESGDGEFKLVHSTARNEIHDYQWESRLKF